MALNIFIIFGSYAAKCSGCLDPEYEVCGCWAVLVGDLDLAEWGILSLLSILFHLQVFVGADLA